MEDFITLASIVPLVLSVVAFVSSLVSVRRRTRAESEFIGELSKVIATMHSKADRVGGDVTSSNNSPPESGRRVLHVNIASPREGGGEDNGIKYSIAPPENPAPNRDMYHIYFTGVKGRGENKELPEYVKIALGNLDKRERVEIVKALNQPSVKGRMRYFDKVLKMAFNLTSAHKSS
ncbi:hypothetical protein [Pseudomonas tussilaginis]|uniref:hypothetical protein n=1 Tax=Pseudomonas sp. 5 TaxID=1619949 RepID=UPI0005EBDBDF|nr:hypothetical protein [Pseudomonas sp. 5]KJK05336.1 hypothetical protein UB47_22265 [Pseudomonas sp. 5]